MPVTVAAVERASDSNSVTVTPSPGARKSGAGAAAADAGLELSGRGGHGPVTVTSSLAATQSWFPTVTVTVGSEPPLSHRDGSRAGPGPTEPLTANAMPGRSHEPRFPGPGPGRPD